MATPKLPSFILLATPLSTAKVYTTMSSTLISGSNKEYYWKADGIDGLRSFSYNASNPNWNYSEITNPNKTESEAYTFTDSSTGQPSARRGNLYNLTTATLGSSLGITNRQAPDSLCPRNWQLPTTAKNLSASATEMTNKSFAKLLRTYGITQLNNDTDTTSTSRLNEWPLQYLRTGYYEYSNGYVAGRTASGYWWSGVTASAINGYNLRSWPNFINAQYYNDRGTGFARRCVPPKSTPP